MDRGFPPHFHWIWRSSRSPCTFYLVGRQRTKTKKANRGREPTMRYKAFLRRAKEITVGIERKLSALLEDSFNPLYYHGAIPTMIFWAVLASGVFLFFYYTPTLEKAYTSVEYISK